MRLPASVSACVLVAVLAAGCGASPQATTGTTPDPAGSTAAPTAAPSAASSASAPASASAPSAAERIAGWSSDLDLLLPGIEQLHPEPFHSTPRDVLAAAIEDLRATIPTATDDELMAGVMRIVALLSAKGRDSHSGAYVWGTGSYPVHSLPLRLWQFPEGMVVVDALPPYTDLIGKRITAIDGRPLDEVAAALDPLIPRDNEQTVTLLLPRFLLTTEILHGAGLIDDPAQVALTIDGERAPVAVDAIPMADYNEWATPYGLFLPIRPAVRSLARSEEPLWFEADGDTLYVQYSRVTDLRPLDQEALEAALDDPGIRRVIVDIRHNYGGESSGFPPVADAIASRADRWPDNLFLVTGRNTYSAGSLFAADLIGRTDVRLVGEPMGGSPNLYGNSRDLALPYSGLSASIATGWFERLPGDDRLLIEPSIPVELTAADYFADRDPALEAIEAIAP